MPELEKHLPDGETLLWTGKPDFKEFLDAVYKPALLRRILICAVLCVILEALYVWAVTVTAAARFNWIFVLIVFGICAWNPLAMVTRTRALQKKYRYGATERRLIVATADKAWDMAYACIRTAAFKRDEAGNAALLCGPKAVKAKSRKWREITFFGNRYNDDETEECREFALYAPSDPKKLKEVLKGRLAFSDET